VGTRSQVVGDGRRTLVATLIGRPAAKSPKWPNSTVAGGVGEASYGQ